MDSIIIEGGTQLKGEIKISGAKNAVLPLIAAALLTDETVILKNVPKLSDIDSLITLLRTLGADVERYENHSNFKKISNNQNDSVDDFCDGTDTLYISAKNITNFEASYDLVRKMRASVLVLGPLLARFKKAKVSLPGGCAIGVRPIDFHISGLQKLNAQIFLEDGYINASSKGQLIGNEIDFPKISVTGTENILMAAVLAKGETKILNAAAEPEIVDLCNMLISMGAKIKGHGTNEITVTGVDSLHGTTHVVISDRIELGTYILSTAITKGNVTIRGKNISILAKPLLGIYHKIGLNIQILNDHSLNASMEGNSLHGITVETAPHPGFPTDLQAQLMAAMTVADSESYIKENIWENRFMHVPELTRMGADIKLLGNVAQIKPVTSLNGAPVTATDLRASFSLVMAGLVAKGTTLIRRVYHLDRGYEKVEEKLSNCGAKIKRLKND